MKGSYADEIPIPIPIRRDQRDRVVGEVRRGGWRVAQLPANPKGECEFVRLAIRGLRGTFAIASYAIIGVTHMCITYACTEKNDFIFTFESKLLQFRDLNKFLYPRLNSFYNNDGV